jgi:hypothetical protein
MTVIASVTSSQFEPKTEPNGLACREPDAVPAQRSKTAQLDAHVIRAGRERLDRVLPVVAGDHGARPARLDSGDGDRRTGHRGARLVQDVAGQRPCGNLRPDRRRRRRADKQEDPRPHADRSDHRFPRLQRLQTDIQIGLE